MTPAETKAFRAGARAQLATGVHITTHCTGFDAETSQLTLLEEEGVDLRRVVIGHTAWHIMDKDVRKSVLQWMQRGANFLPTNLDVTQPEQWQGLIDAIHDIFQAGYGDKLVLGLDSGYCSEYSAPRTTLGDGHITLSDWVQAGRYTVGLDALTLAGGPSAPPPLMPANSMLATTRITIAKSSREVLLPKTNLQRGRTGTVALVLNGAGNENALGGTLRFDPTRLRFVNAVTSAGNTLLVNAIRAPLGRVAVSVMRPLPQAFPAGQSTAVTLIFQVPVTAPRGTTTITFNDTMAQCAVTNVLAETLPATFTAGTITIR